MNLVPVADATHIAVNNGSWFDPNTWANGEVPGAGAKVLIPSGFAVDYDGESPASLFTVRVDGMLHFATDQNSFMEVDTLIVSPTGHLTMGTVSDPVEVGVTATIQIADNGPIDVGWDPMLLSRGVISHGAVEIHGQEKDPFLKVSVDPMAGDTSMVLESAPVGWEVGDTLVLTGTKLSPVGWQQPETTWNFQTEDEELTIVGINGNTILFDKPLQYDHDGPRADLKAYVANYSRNVTIETENSDSIPVHQRGHVMFMHSDNVDVRYAEFAELGRTDKSERAFDAGDVSNMQADTNVKGRYALHLHRTGVSDLDDPAMVVGNSVWGSPGWGYVHHDSNAVLVDNAAYDVFGAAFVTETGNETGRWSHNISIKNGGVANGPKHGPDIDAFDFGRNGVGFWFQGRMVDAVDNVAAGSHGGHGYVYNSRGWKEDVIRVTADSMAQPETLNYQDDHWISTPHIAIFDGNESIANQTGLEIFKVSPIQGNDMRTWISDFTAWEVATGMHLHYTGHYTVENFDAVAMRTAGLLYQQTLGIKYGANAIDMVVNGANLDGFYNGVSNGGNLVNIGVDESLVDREYTYIDVNFQNIVNQDFDGLHPDSRILSSSQLSNQQLSYKSNIQDFTLAPSFAGDQLILDGVRTDSLGQANISANWDPHVFDFNSLRGAIEQEGYWTLADGRKVTMFDQYITDRATGEVIKTGVFVEIRSDISVDPADGFVRVTPTYHGVLDTNNAGPNATDDAFTVKENSSIVLDVLANDSDPDGDPIALDGFLESKHGLVTANADGTIDYRPDANYTGSDEFWYWVEDDAGNFSKAHVQITVEV